MFRNDSAVLLTISVMKRAKMQHFAINHQSKHYSPNLSAGLAWVLPASEEFHPTVKTVLIKETSVKRLRTVRHSCERLYVQK